MKQDKDTIQSLLDKLSGQEQMLRNSLDQKFKEVERMKEEIEQQKGAISYNIILANELRDQLKKMAEEAEQVQTKSTPQP